MCGNGMFTVFSSATGRSGRLGDLSAFFSREPMHATPVTIFLSRCRILFPVTVTIGMLCLTAPRSGAQDIAAAARQERARKAEEKKSARHVYDEDDLTRRRILTPEDRAQLEVKRKSQTPSSSKEAEAADVRSHGLTPAQSEIPVQHPAPKSSLSLGDVARRFRRESKQNAPELERAQQFHLPLNAPAFAAPLSELAPLGPVTPASPRPNAVKPSLRFVPERIDPFHPGVHAPRRPALQLPMPAVPNASTPEFRAAQRGIVVVQRGDSLWKIAARELGDGQRWRELLAGNRTIANPDNIQVGAEIRLPTTSGQPHFQTQITVRPHDTLSAIAQRELGNGSLWRCLLRENPAITKADVIYSGRLLFIPESCRSNR